MGLLDDIARVRDYLERHGRVSYRVLEREFGLDDDGLEDILEELVDIQGVAARGDKALSWTGSTSPPAEPAVPARVPRTYTPKHLADKILQSRAALEGERKQVTVLFCDIKGSMELAAALGAETWHEVLDEFFTILGEAIHRYEGTVNQYTGDGVMALFGAPIAHEDHAARACYAALVLRDRLKVFADRLRVERGVDLAVRTGLNSGDVVVGRIGDDLRMDYTAQGATVGIAQRIEQLAAAGRVYLGEVTARLVSGFFALSDLGPSRLAGVVEPVRIHELVSASASRTRFEVARSRGLTRFVGRDAELQALEAAFARASEGHGQVVGVVGDAGLGKSRLCHEFVERRRAQGTVVVAGHCPAHGRNIPLIPILELYRNYFGITQRDAAEEARRKIAGALVLLDPALHADLPLLFDFLGVADPARPAPPLDADTRQRRILDMLRHVYRSLAEHGTAAVLFIDDVHWIDPASDAFLAQMVQFIAEHSRILLLLNFRPEYTAPWMRRAHYLQLPLTPLGPAAIEAMVASLLGRDPSLAGLARRIVDWTGGNPFYAEEVINDLVERGHVTGRIGHYTLVTDGAGLAMPSNVRAVLAARLDRLPDNAKQVLQAAAVIGREFDLAVIEGVADLPGADLAAALERLEQGDFVYQAVLHPELAYAFKHPLTHEVAYGSLLRARLKDLHAAAARAIEARAGDKLDEQSSLLAYHWDAAEVVDQAATWHARAAKWSELSDASGALRHWRRARELLTGPGASDAMLSAAARACAHIMTLQWRLGAPQEDVLRDFEQGTELAGKVGDMVSLAQLNGAFGAHRGVNFGHADDYVRYVRDAIRCAEADGSTELLFALRCTYLIPALVETGRWEEVVALAEHVDNMDVPDALYGSTITGTTPLLAAHVCTYWAQVSRGYGERAEQVRARIVSGPVVEQAQEIALYGATVQVEAAALGGAVDVTVARARDVERLAARVPTTLGRVFAGVSAGVAARCRGDHAAARTALEEALHVADAAQGGNWYRPTVLAHLALTLLSAGHLTEAVTRAHEAVEFCRPRGWRLSMLPWIARAETLIAADDQDAARAAMAELAEVVDDTNSAAWRPFVHECRAAFAQRFHGDWDVAAELAEAGRLFAELGAMGQVARLRAAASGDTSIVPLGV
ncbi:MAG: AAA family ATPase [Gammaproteobacteria bacterium]